MTIIGPLSVQIDQRVSFTCRAFGGPNNTYTWKLNGIEIEEDEDSQYNITTSVLDSSSSSVLVILRIVPAIHSGAVLSCSVSNLAGSGSDSHLITGKHK